MASHICPRCGHEDRCEYGSWADRHPVLSTIAGLFTLTLMAMMFSIYPIAAWTITGLAAAWFTGRSLARERQRRAALAARAHWEHAEMMARPAVRYAPAPPTNPPTLLPRHVMNAWPTSQMQTRNQR